MKILSTVLGVLLLTLAISVPVAAAPPDNPTHGKPDFNPHIYADGYAWGTKVGPLLPEPNGHNNRSFDLISPILWNGEEVQLPVAESAPGDRAYNGGRWQVFPAQWQHEPNETITSWSQLMDLVDSGDISLSAEAVFYFLCPLLPVLD